MDYEKKIKNALNDKSVPFEVQAWLEEQFSELKESEDEGMVKFIKNQLFNIKKTITENYELDAKLTKAIDWLEKQGEPKFEIGDLITNGILVGKIDEIHEWGYHAYFGDHYADVPDIENWHKWTIQDAKDGNALFTSSTASHETFIFKSIDEKGNVKCYFAYDSEDGFREGKYHFIGRATNCKPATKEQYDTLMKAMADAGYTFDFEKKELKKIEQKPAEWSEEDERCLLTIQKIICDSDTSASLANKLSNWVQSFKDRVQPQSKPNWSEEDEKCIRLSMDIIESALRAGFCVQIDRDRCVDWLNSLRSQKQWRPSEDQMKALAEALSLAKNCGEESAFDLRTLHEQLKKLRKE